jgi:CYTH domain-containing protein
MPIEIERKFLAEGDPATWTPPVVATAAWIIRQGYVTRPGDDPEVRVRHARPVAPRSALDDEPRPVADGGDAAEVRQLTTKASVAGADGGAVSRHEIEVPVSEAQLDELWLVTAGRRIEKVRVEYRFADDDDAPAFTVDRFGGALSGLVLAEIEFGDEAASRAFDPPAFLRTEVTEDRRYRNAALAAMAAPPDAGAPDSGPRPTGR